MKKNKVTLFLSLIILTNMNMLNVNAVGKINTPTAGVTNKIHHNTRAGVTLHLTPTNKPSIDTEGIVKVGTYMTSDEVVNEMRAKKAEENETNYVMSSAYNVPNNEALCRSDAFSYEYRQNITKKTSAQYQQLLNPGIYTDPNGYVKLGDRYLIAVGTGYAKNVGDKIDVLYEDGTILKCIVGDFKSDRHTDSSHRYHVGGIETRLVDVDTGENFVLGTDTGSKNVEVRDLNFQGDGSVVEFILDWNYSARKIGPVGQKILKVVNVTNIDFASM